MGGAGSLGEDELREIIVELRKKTNLGNWQKGSKLND
jgi:hypothetical protein